VDILSQFLYYKTQDVGKIYVVFVDRVFGYPLLVNLLRRAGGGFTEPSRILARAEKAITYHQVSA
jgi:hypothetical protein